MIAGIIAQETAGDQVDVQSLLRNCTGVLYFWLPLVILVYIYLILGYLTAVNGMEHNIRCGDLHILLFTGHMHGMCKCVRR